MHGIDHAVEQIRVLCRECCPRMINARVHKFEACAQLFEGLVVVPRRLTGFGAQSWAQVSARV